MTTKYLGKPLDAIMIQIKNAPHSSPIAVFRCDEPGRLIAVYWTSTTRAIVEGWTDRLPPWYGRHDSKRLEIAPEGKAEDFHTKLESFIGKFDRDDALDVVRRKLAEQIVGQTEAV